LLSYFCQHMWRVFLLVVLFLLIQETQQQLSCSCRFAKKFTKEMLLTSEDARNKFLMCVFQKEANFHVNRVGYNSNTGFTYDGHVLNYVTGNLSTAPGALHDFSAASKEALHLILLARALEGNPYARIFINPNDPNNTNLAIKILKKKLDTYNKFNKNYPGFGGYLPWVRVNDKNISLLPEWSNRVPSLDNGEWLWGLFAVARACKTLNMTGLARAYRNYFKLLAKNANMIFNNGDGFVRAEARILNISAKPTKDNYLNNVPGYFLDDPYEGELFVLFADLYGNWTGYETTRDLIWKNKVKKLFSVEYVTPQGNMTVEQGNWYSAHEKWKVLEMPYLSVNLYKRLFINGEKVRTQNSNLLKIPGLYASCANISLDRITPYGYVSAVGIQSIAKERIKDHDLITPYGNYPVSLANLTVGLIWYHNMILGAKMQGIYGSTESCDLAGTKIGNVVTWDSKITSLCGFIGGSAKLVEEGLREDGKFKRFQNRIQNFYAKKFQKIKGENISYALPVSPVPQGQADFTTCTN